MKKRLFYNEVEREFYFVTKRPKSILIEWAENKSPQAWNGMGEVIEWSINDFNVHWDNDFISGNGMIVRTDGKNTKHCLSEYEDDYILIYPYQAGQPFCLEPATKKDIEKEIKHCKSWGVEYDYYTELYTDL